MRSHENKQSGKIVHRKVMKGKRSQGKDKVGLGGCVEGQERILMLVSEREVWGMVLGC